LGGLVLAGCATETKTTVFVPVVAPTPPSSLTPQPVMLFNQTKDGRKLFTLDAEFPYCDVETGKLIVVPRWYVTDFASVPWYGQGFVDPQGPTARAAIVHDWLYTIGEPGKRQEADDIFLRAMLKYGVPPFQANVAYKAVRIGGEKGYGLPTDWKFTDPKRQDFFQPAPFAKPRTGRGAGPAALPGLRGPDPVGLAGLSDQDPDRDHPAAGGGHAHAAGPGEGAAAVRRQGEKKK
jgi:hypothetical protein